jgi:hypothetical protein
MRFLIGSLRPVAYILAGVIIGVLLAFGWGVYNSSAQTTGGCQAFSQTGHKVCGKFLDYWNRHGGLAQQGYPLSEEFTETSALDGKPYTVQYFERAVFEAHPENKAPNDVLLSQLGTYLGHAKYTRGFPTTSGETPFYEDRTSAVGGLLSFYNAINRKEYDRAYGYFQGAPNPQPSLAPPYQQFVAGYADTVSVSVAVGKVTQGAAAGNLYASMAVVLTAKHKDGSTARFSGCYVMHRVNDGISPDPNDELWSINSASLSPAPANASLDQLLGQQCAQ